ncbi:hypothetical protein BCV69DRAFT_283724 [Microstroma glucosiphilum]|uniref:Uncharacterized protein n=1 Tax=Pseudomicrostroma glucosiphilum TaxID=1684307 RepID=A0A316U2S1_9BASI|nr:hypothetical protein BCV69DRAFT_283724 [Pseudomicrostroma glucosiphilum]PWN19612.1 hypothetical protein BCV69DRAFT_283724 [Pseudomicrostroma glucosiphilum]
MPALQRRAGALSGVTQSASDGVQAGYDSVKALSLSRGQIAAVVVAIVLVLGLTILALWYLCIRQTRKRKLRRSKGAQFGSEGPSMRMEETSGARGSSQQRSRPAAKADFVPYDFTKVGRGSGRASGYGDYSQVQGSSGGRGGDRGQRIYEEQGDDASLMSESTLMGDGPTVPLVAAAGADVDSNDWTRGHRQSVRFSRQHYPSQGRS